MVIAYVDNDDIARTCPREYLKFQLMLAQNGLTLEEYALILDQIKAGALSPERKEDLKKYKVVDEAYTRLRRKAERRKNINLNLTIEGTFSKSNPSSNGFYRPKPNIYKDINNNPVPNESMAKPIWMTQLKLAPHLKKENVKVVIKA